MNYEITDGILKASVNTGDVFTVDGKKYDYAGTNTIVERKLTEDDLRRAKDGTLDVEFLLMNQLMINEIGKIKERLGH